MMAGLDTGRTADNGRSRILNVFGEREKYQSVGEHIAAGLEFECV